MPSGGPIDEIPPEILETLPLNGQLNTPTDTEITFTFSEKMDRTKVELAYFISPVPADEPEFKWKGKSLIVRYESGLVSGRTYVINIGSTAEDLHRIKMDKSYSLAFSTGSTIDEGAIKGKVYTNEQEVNATVWAYLVEDDIPPLPFERPGDYITQTDKEGNFTLTNLFEGKYRVYIIKDNNQDKDFALFSDEIGIPQNDVMSADSSRALPMYFQTSATDTMPPSAMMVQSINMNHFKIRFTEDLIPKQYLADDVEILNLTGQKVVEDSLLYLYKDEEFDNILNVYSTVLQAGQEYQLSIKDISDKHGNTQAVIKDSLTIFENSADTDTTGLYLVSVSPEDSTNEIPVYSGIFFTFNKPVDVGSFSQGFGVTDSLGMMVPGVIIINTPLELEFQPETYLNTLARYNFSLDTLLINGVDGSRLQHQKTDYTFESENIRQTAILTGRIDVIGELSGNIIVQLTNPEKTVSRDIILTEQGTFEFDVVKRGDYTLSAFIDTDGNGTWTKGKLKPFSYAEPFVIYPDILTIRPGIDNTENNMTIIIH